MGGRARILDIARATGDEMQESFSRAFKLHYGVTPGEFRRAGKLRFEHKKASIDAAYLAHLNTGVARVPLLQRFPERLPDVPQRVPGACHGVLFQEDGDEAGQVLSRERLLELTRTPGAEVTDRKIELAVSRLERARAGAGHGLGLAIARELAENDGARLWLANREGGGRRALAAAGMGPALAARPAQEPAATMCRHGHEAIAPRATSARNTVKHPVAAAPPTRSPPAPRPATAARPAASR